MISLGGVWPLHRAVPPEQHRTELLLVAAGGIALYAFATVRYVRLARRRADPLPGALAAAWVLLAEALLATAVSRSWHLSWWEWHVLMACAFGLVAYAARAGYRRGSSVTAAFGGVYLDGTLERLDARTGDALRLLVDALERDAPLAPVLEELHARGLSWTRSLCSSGRPARCAASTVSSAPISPPRSQPTSSGSPGLPSSAAPSAR